MASCPEGGLSVYSRPIGIPMMLVRSFLASLRLTPLLGPHPPALYRRAPWHPLYLGPCLHVELALRRHYHRNLKAFLELGVLLPELSQPWSVGPRAHEAGAEAGDREEAGKGEAQCTVNDGKRPTSPEKKPRTAALTRAHAPDPRRRLLQARLQASRASASA